MAQMDVLEEEVTITSGRDADMMGEREKARFAAEDLQRIEEDARREAEAYVEAADGDGDKKASVEAAGSAFDFEEAKLETARTEGRAQVDAAGVRHANAERAGDANAPAQTARGEVSAQANRSEASADHKQGGILESVKESLGKAGETVKEAAVGAKESAKAAIDNTRARM